MTDLSYKINFDPFVLNFLYLSPASIALWLLFGLAVLVIIRQPRHGLYMIVGLSLASDLNSLPWFPLEKGFSSVDSILYIHRGLIVSPLEIFLALTLGVWLVRGVVSRKLNFYRGPLFLPVVVFGGFILIGLVYGYLTQGDMYVGLWEARPIFYLPIMFVLTSNLIETRAQANTLFWVAMIALFVLGSIGAAHWFFIRGAQLSRFDADIEHAAAIRLNSLFVMAIAVWLYSASRLKRIVLPLGVPLVLVTYYVAERRAAWVTLGIALILMALVLFKENRRRFWRAVPIALLIVAAYALVFWNDAGPMGLPVRTYRDITLGNGATVQEESSDIYRVYENYDVAYTLQHASPWTGIGFGHKFLTPLPLPDISFFTWWQYFPHNSILWIWLSTGAGGFFALLFLIGWAILVGVQNLAHISDPDLRAFMLTATLYLIMHFVFAYVDISFDYRSMLYVGMMLGVLNKLPRIAAPGLAVQGA